MSELPTVSVYKDGLHARINVSDAPEWAERGWHPMPPADPFEAPPAEQEAKPVRRSRKPTA